MGKIQGCEKSDEFGLGHFVVKVFVGHPSLTIKQT